MTEKEPQSNPATTSAPKNILHRNVKGVLLSDFEMLVTMKPGSRIRSRTFRGDTTLAEYHSYNISLENQLSALMYKFTNINARAARAVIYDNTGPVKRREIFVYENGIIQTNLTGI